MILGGRCLKPLVSGLWLVVLVGSVAIPPAIGSDESGSLRIRLTIWQSLLGYAMAAGLMLSTRPRTSGQSFQVVWSRLCWTLVCAAYLVHVGLAFHFRHDWSHARALAHVESVSGVGEGVFASYLFTLVWMGDVAWWWWAAPSYGSRRPWLKWLVHGYLAFIIFNGTVVFETGASRWVGVLMVVGLVVLLVALRCRPLANQSQGTSGYLQPPLSRVRSGPCRGHPDLHEEV